jgi:thiamine biosynthesis lipoprotein
MTSLRNLKRRDFLKLASIAGLGLTAPLFGPLLNSSNLRGADRFEISTDALGTTISIKVEDASSPINARAAMNSSVKEIKRLESILTRFGGTSDVSRLNVSSLIESPPPELVDVLNRASRYSERTEGAFDITVKPVLDLFDRTSGAFLPPTDAEFDAAKNLIDYERVSTSPHAILLGRAGMGITLDCLAKGYILDRVAEMLKAHNIKSALIDGGGSLVAIGSRYNGSPWKIAVRDPVSPEESIGTIALVDEAVATSGDYENAYTSDKRYYHIIDPHSARSPLYSHCATVIAPTAAEADPLALSLMVTDPSDVPNFIEGFTECECLVMTRNSGLVKSNGFGMT